jgi:hypothetical protein
LKPFDHRLLDLKLQQLSAQMQEQAGKCWGHAQEEAKRLGNQARLLPSFTECQMEALRSYLVAIDKCVREVQLMDQHSITPLFIRQVLVPRLFSVIAARKGSIQHELELQGRRSGENNAAASTQFVLKIGELESETSTRYEIEAKTLESQSVPERVVTRAPRPPSEVGGRMASYSVNPPLKVPPSPPTYFDPDLWPKASVVLIEARNRFQDHSKLFEFCTEVIEQLTPVFRVAVESGRFKARDVLSDSGMTGLLHSILIYNDGGPKSGMPGLSNDAYELEQKVLQSDEWLALAKTVAELKTTQPPQKSSIQGPIDIVLGDLEFYRLVIPDLQLHRLEAESDELVLSRLAKWDERLSQLRQADPQWNPSDPSHQTGVGFPRAQAEMAVKQLRTVLALRGKLPETGGPAEGSRTEGGTGFQFTHSPDYRAVTLNGVVFSLTSRQAQLIEILHKAYKSGHPIVAIARALEQLGTSTSRWQDTFKSNPQAKKALITGGDRKGTFRLNI